MGFGDSRLWCEPAGACCRRCRCTESLNQQGDDVNDCLSVVSRFELFELYSKLGWGSSRGQTHCVTAPTSLRSEGILRMGWLVPVGIPGGVNTGLDGVPPGSGIVRLGRELCYLDFGLYRLWRAAAAAPQTVELISWGIAQGIPNVDDSVRALEDAELLIEEGPDVYHRVGRLAIRLIGECLGNGNEASPTFLVLGRNNAQVRVDASLFEVLMRCDGVSPVSIICEVLDASHTSLGYPSCIKAL